MQDQVFPIKAHAKLNLRLKVVGRNADDYHLLSMLNVTLGLADEMAVRIKSNPGIECEVQGDETIHGSNNLVVKAYQGFSSRFAGSVVIPGLNCILTKRIPSGAGLGGGSSDAAAMLRFLLSIGSEGIMNHEGLSWHELFEEVEKIGLRLGADIPYFLHGGVAVVRGIGEQITPVENLIPHTAQALLVFPRIHVSTERVFRTFKEVGKLPVSSGDAKFEEFLMASGKLTPEDNYRRVLELVDNDLLGTCIYLEPKIGEILEIMQASRLGVAGMTGSGSTLFFLPHELERCEETIEPLQKQIAEVGAESIWTKIS